MIFRNLTRFIVLATGAVAILSLGFHTPVVAARPGQSSDVPAIASFDDGTDRIRSDSGGQYVHKALSSDGGWADFPGTGNFTMKTAGDSKKAQQNGRKLTLEFADPLALPPSCGLLASGEPAPILGTPVPAFMSVNRVDGGAGGLEGMMPDGTVAAGIGGNFQDPNDSRATFIFRCGLHLNDKNACGTDEAKATCVAAAPLSGTCLKWRVEPALARDQLRCRLWRDKQGNSALIGDYNMPFGLTIFRDADSDGNPDLGN